MYGRLLGAGLKTNHNFGKESRIFGVGDIYFNMIVDLLLESFISKLGNEWQINSSQRKIF